MKFDLSIFAQTARAQLIQVKLSEQLIQAGLDQLRSDKNVQMVGAQVVQAGLDQLRSKQFCGNSLAKILISYFTQK